MECQLERDRRQLSAVNTEQRRASVSHSVRPPLGAVRSRVPRGDEDVPAPPARYWLAKFATDFANRPQAMEKLSLVREDDGRKVVGYWIE